MNNILGREVKERLQYIDDIKVLSGETKDLSESANSTANEAKQIAEDSDQKSDSTQQQLDQVVIDGDSSVEAAQARVDSDGDSYTTLKERLDTEHSGLNQQLAEKAIQTETIFTKGKYSKKIKYPTEVATHTLPINIYNNMGKFFTDFNPRSLKPVRTNTYLVNPLIGNDTNDGLSKSTPFKSIEKALSMTGDNEIQLSAGKYYHKDGWKGYNPAKGISVICPKGKAELTNEAYPRRWTEDPTYPGLYSAPTLYNGEDFSVEKNDLRFIVREYDTFESGGTQLYVKTVSQLQSGEFGFVVGSTSTMVRLQNNLDPNEYLSIKYNKDNIVCKENLLVDSTIYLENIHAYYGSTSPIQIDTSTILSKVVMINIKSFDARFDDGIQLTCTGLAVLWDCEGSSAYTDGINYYINSGVSGSNLFDVVEVNCKGKHNGRDTTGNNNGSTGHSSVRNIRLNCDYGNNQDRNVHDVSEGWSFNVGVEARHSENDKEDFSCGLDSQGIATRMWLVGCEAGKIVAQSGATIYKEIGSSFDSESGTGTIVEFDPYY
ncbi:DUF1565 domain-containing protein [Salipaludibacillus sp. CF4.18]|uniref:DUF1565 domain-containing protein n=1 Tax=Salipaludibacillus sp. CF4.18 TaxID=3373081 RepID=UPI003EE4EABB